MDDTETHYTVAGKSAALRSIANRKNETISPIEIRLAHGNAFD